MENAPGAKSKGLIQRITSVGMVLSASCIAITVVLVTIEIILRNVFKTTTRISDEFSGYLLVATLFLGVAYAKSTNGLVRVDMLLNIFSRKTKAIVEILIYLLSIVYSSALLYFCTTYMLKSFSSKTVSLSFVHMPLYIPQCLMVIGLAMFLLQLFADLAAVIRGQFSDPKEEER